MIRIARLPALLACAAALLVGCGGDAPERAVASSEGEALYQAHCAMCHGDGLLGDGPMAAGLPVEPPSLFEHLGHHTEAQLIGLIQSGVPPAMPPAPVSEDEVRLIVDYAWALVPDSLVDGLREMQREMEAGEAMPDSARMAPDGMDHAGMGHAMPTDTTGR